MLPTRSVRIRVHWALMPGVPKESYSLIFSATQPFADPQGRRRIVAAEPQPSPIRRQGLALRSGCSR